MDYDDNDGYNGNTSGSVNDYGVTVIVVVSIIISSIIFIMIVAIGGVIVIVNRNKIRS